MNILLGNNSLEYLAGSETWTESLALSLRHDGHDVRCYGRTLGVISERLRENGVPCASAVGVFDNFAPELIIASHWPVVELLGKAFDGVPLVSVIHGVFHRDQDGSRALEHPLMSGRVDAFVSVSEEVRDKLRDDYGLASAVIRNGILVDRFSVRPTAAAPKRILYVANHVKPDSPEVSGVREVASRLDAELLGVGSDFTASASPWRQLESSDIVFGMGRSVLEGVAMGRLGVVHGRWGTGGVIHPGSVRELRRCNFSARNGNGEWWQPERLIEEIGRYYRSRVLDWGPRYVAAHHDARSMAREFVKLGRSLSS